MAIQQSAPAWEDLTTADLASAARNGSREAFGWLVRRYQDQLWQFLAYQSGAPQLADDLTQTTFIQAYERLDQLQDPAAFVPWLFSIARRIWQMHHRSYRANILISLSTLGEKRRLPAALVHHQQEIERLPERATVRGIVASLKPSLQDALYLRHVAGFSDQEISAALEISVAAAQKRAYRAEIMFRKRYDELGTAEMEGSSGSEDNLFALLPTISHSKS
jgi:RNA polymerase sigma-70 factor (ECF subfamily)